MPQIFLLLVSFFSITPSLTCAETILALGDSLTAGLGVMRAESWPEQLEQRLNAGGYAVRIVNAGISGDTTAGGKSRLGWSLGGGSGFPDIAIVALGGNDALRGLAPSNTRENLEDILSELKTRKIKILLAGMLAPPNLGEAYGIEFAAIFGDLAAKYGALLYPFILDGVAAIRWLNQPDGIHPNAQGHAIIARRIEPYVVKLLTQD